jgi:hypothetical protein
MMDKKSSALGRAMEASLSIAQRERKAALPQRGADAFSGACPGNRFDGRARLCSRSALDGDKETSFY